MSPAANASIPPAMRPGIARWTITAWSRLGWKQVVLAAAIYVIHPFFGPNGGLLLYPGRIDFVMADGLLRGAYLFQYLPIIFAAMVADAAHDDGVPAWSAYATAWLVTSIGVPWLQYFAARLVIGGLVIGVSFWVLVYLLQGSLAMWLYASWHTTRLARRRVQEAELQRLVDRQQLNSTRLMGLQARIDPDMLFDALSHVGQVHLRDPTAADRMLADLIAFLRALLPGRSLALSSVEREAGLVDAWLRVRSFATSVKTVVNQEFAPEVGSEAIAPMVVLPLVQAAIGAGGGGRSWLLAYTTTGLRIRVSLRADDCDTHPVPRAEMLQVLRQRVGEVYGDRADLTIDAPMRQVLLDLPRLAPTAFS